MMEPVSREGGAVGISHKPRTLQPDLVNGKKSFMLYCTYHISLALASIGPDNS